jgi:hypothetical protein
MLPPLSIPDTIAVLRRRYAAALVCVVCAVLLATQPASYAQSRLTEAARLEYVCAECRQDAAEAARVAEIRAVVARENLVKARASRARQDPERGNIRPPIVSVVRSIRDAQSDADLQDSKLSTSRVDLAKRRRRGGRTALPGTERRLRRRESQRKWRAKSRPAA